MNHVINEMLKKYLADGLADKKNAVKEIMQEIVLCGLSRAGFFKKAAFYGGTVLVLLLIPVTVWIVKRAMSQPFYIAHSPFGKRG